MRQYRLVLVLDTDNPAGQISTRNFDIPLSVNVYDIATAPIRLTLTVF